MTEKTERGNEWGYSSRSWTGVAKNWAIHWGDNQGWAQVSRTKRKKAATPRVRTCGATRGCIEQMSQAHELMKPFHRIPVIHEFILKEGFPPA